MPISNENTNKLFRTLEPDDSRSQLAARAAARDAEQRWPLLKAALPKKWETIPDLTSQETEHRDQQAKPVARPRKRALSLPGTGDLMLTGLQKMAVQRVVKEGRSATAPQRGPRARAIPEVAPEVGNPADLSPPMAAQSPLVKSAGKAREKAPLADQVVTPEPVVAATAVPVEAEPLIPEKRRSLFASLKGAVTQESAAPDRPLDKSLGGVFSRLASSKVAVPAPPSSKRSPVSKKLGPR